MVSATSFSRSCPKTLWLRIGLLLLICLLGGGSVMIFTALALPDAPGDLDPTFDGDGRVVTSVSSRVENGQALVIQPDGKIVVAGSSERPSPTNTYYLTLVRYHPDGSLDTTYTGDGVFTMSIALDDAARAVALQPDGKIVAAGRTVNGDGPAFALVRTLANGDLDTGFGTNGVVTVPIGMAEAHSLQIQPDGKIVVGGQSEGSPTTGNFALARTLADGSLDATFGVGGVVTTAVSAGIDRLRALTLLPDGRILATGASSPNGADSTFALAQYDGMGMLDSSFGISGLLTVAVGTRDEGFDLALQPDGRFIMAGTTITSVPNFPSILIISSALLRFEASGSLDTSFGQGGVVTNSFGTAQETGRAVIVQPDGQIVIAGTTVQDIDHAQFALARYLTDGSPDTTFGSNGIVQTVIGPNTNNGRDLALQADGKLVLVGHTLSASRVEGDIALARYESMPVTTHFIFLPVVVRQP